MISSIFWEIFWNIFREHLFLPRSFQKFLPFAFLPSGSFRIDFLCRPSAPGLSQGHARVCRASTVQNKETPGFVTGFHRICPRDKPGEIPGTNPGSSQDQPDKNNYVYVPFSCLKVWPVKHKVSACMWAAAEIYYQNSCRSHFSGVYLVFEVFQDDLALQ